MKKKLLALALLLGLSVPALAGTGALSPSHIYDVMVRNTFGLFVSLGGIPGAIIVDKFGENPDVTESEDVWEEGGIYNFTADGGTTYYISSSNAADTQTIEFQVLTDEGNGNWNLEVFEQDLLGTTKTALLPPSGDPIVRIFRMQNQADTGGDLVGKLYVYEDDTTTTPGIPDSAGTVGSKVRAVMVNGNNQTLMAIYTIPTGYVGFLFEGELGQSFSAGPNATDYAKADYRSRRYGKVFKVKKRVILITTGASIYRNPRYFPDPIPAKTDIKLFVEEVSDSMGVWGTFCILLIPEDSWYITSGFLDAIGQIRRVE